MHRSSANIDYTGHVHAAHSAERCVLECALLGVVRVVGCCARYIVNIWSDVRRRVRRVLLETDRDNANNSQHQCCGLRMLS